MGSSWNLNSVTGKFTVRSPNLSSLIYRRWYDIQLSVVKFSELGESSAAFFVFCDGTQLHRPAFLSSTSCCLPKPYLLSKTQPQLHSHQAILRLYTVTYTDKCASCMRNILSRLVSQCYVIYSILTCCLLSSIKMGCIETHSMMAYWAWSSITVCWEKI
jgi:hypothetical protein